MQMEKREIIQDELEQLAPSLRLQQKSTLQAPSGYFEELPGKLLAIVNAEQKKRSTLIFFRSPQWKVLAAAAVMIGILFSSFYFFKNSATDGADTINQWAKQEVSKLPAEHVSDYIDNTSAFLQTASTSQLDSKDLAMLMQDIPQEEIQNLLNDLPVTEMP
jgi:hypothetical protein